MSKTMMRGLVLVACSIVLIGSAYCEVIRGIDIDFVDVGNAGNEPDSRVMSDGTTGHGSVGYEYRIGKYEVTNSQWNAFVAAAGAPTGSPSNAYENDPEFTGGQQPTTNVSWYEAIQFCNWLTSGDKSEGVYLFSGNNSNPASYLGVDRETALLAYGTIYVLPTEDEWYKAAYHKNDNATGNYWLYPTQSDDVPSNDLMDPDPGNNANFYQDGYTVPSVDGWVTDVGEFENSPGPYGTFDQGGNVWEWTETLINPQYNSRLVRGGSYHGGGWVGNLRSWYRHFDGLPYGEDKSQGFRIASLREPRTLESLAIVGADEVGEGESCQYRAVATYDSGYSRDVTNEASWWIEPAGIAGIDANGLLTVGGIIRDAQATVHGAYCEDEVTASAQKPVLCLREDPAQLAIANLAEVLAEKVKMLEKLDELLEKEAAAYAAMDELLLSGDYDNLQKGQAVKARQGIHTAMQQEVHAADDLNKSLWNVEDVLVGLGWVPEVPSAEGN